MEKEFNAIEFLMELDRMAEGCETEEEIHKLYDEEMEKLTDEQKFEILQNNSLGGKSRHGE